MPSLVSELRAILGRENVLSAPSELAVYDCDALTIERRRPQAVVFPRGSGDVAGILRIAGRHAAAVVARGAGTSLAGGCLPLGCGGASASRAGSPCYAGAVVVSLARMNKILAIDLRNRVAVVEAGVNNLRLGQALSGSGYHFAPDPSSQGASTIGGNAATNAGGPHTLKYGVTVNHVLGMEAVLADGSIVQLGPEADPAGLDLPGVLVGSEGTLGIVTRLWVRLTADPQDYRTLRATFGSLDDAGKAVSRIIAAGIVPAAMELMDQGILAAVEEAYHFGFSPDAAAVLVIEIDGPTIGLDRQQQRIVELCTQFGARDVLQAASAEQRALLWRCRKMAVGATGRLSPSYKIEDGVVPRTRLPEIMRRTGEIGRNHGIRIVNVGHAGDGNIHPLLLFDERDRGQVARAAAAGREILEACIAAGGTVTGEHGIGVEKLALMERQFAAADLEAMRRVRQAFDPRGRLNPGKLLPEEERGGEGERGRGGDSAANLGALVSPSPPLPLSPSSVSAPPLETLTPADQAAMASAVREAARSGRAVYPTGGGTMLDYGLPPSRPGVRLSTAMLNRVVDYPAEDLTITVEAGRTIAALNEQLAANRQWLPVDVPWPDRATVGGVIATAAAGPRRLAYGTIRDYLLGFTAIDGRGMAFCGGGRVVKNAAGYNMCRLITGSLGTLGVVTQATLMVRPLPETAALLACDLPDLDLAERLLAGLIGSDVRPAAVEFSNGRERPVGEWGHNPLLGPVLHGNVGRLCIGFEGPAGEVEWMLDLARRQWTALGMTSPTLMPRLASDRLWRWIAEFPADVEISVLPGKLVATIAALQAIVPDAGVVAHAADGVIRVSLPSPACGTGAGGEGGTQLQSLVARLRGGRCPGRPDGGAESAGRRGPFARRRLGPAAAGNGRDAGHQGALRSAESAQPGTIHLRLTHAHRRR